MNQFALPEGASHYPMDPREPTYGPACPRGGEIVDYCIGLCSCGQCPTPRPDWTDQEPCVDAGNASRKRNE